jgi:hypothetical protein
MLIERGGEKDGGVRERETFGALSSKVNHWAFEPFLFSREKNKSVANDCIPP